MTNTKHTAAPAAQGAKVDLVAAAEDALWLVKAQLGMPYDPLEYRARYRRHVDTQALFHAQQKGGR